jgi:hypothetical protein
MATLTTSPKPVTPLSAADREYLIELVKEMLIAEYQREVKGKTEGHEVKGDTPCTHS